jgi:hypothetical protein
MNFLKKLIFKKKESYLRPKGFNPLERRIHLMQKNINELEDEVCHLKSIISSLEKEFNL